MMMSLFWVLPLHVWLWEKERKFTEEEQEEELLKISCKTKWSLWPKGWQSGFWSMKRLKISVFLQNQKDFVRIGSHNFGKNIYHYQTAPQTILSCRARGWGEAYKTHHASDVPKLHSCPHKHLLCKWKRQRNKTVAARRDERRVGSLSWNLPTYVPLPSAEISQEMMMMMLSLFCDTGKCRYLHLAKAWFSKKISKVSAANRLLSSTGHSAPPRSLARSLVLLRRSKSAAHVHSAQQSFVSVPHCHALDTLHSSVRSIL